MLPVILTTALDGKLLLNHIGSFVGTRLPIFTAHKGAYTGGGGQNTHRSQQHPVTPLSRRLIL